MIWSFSVFPSFVLCVPNDDTRSVDLIESHCLLLFLVENAATPPRSNVFSFLCFALIERDAIDLGKNQLTARLPCTAGLRLMHRNVWPCTGRPQRMTIQILESVIFYVSWSMLKIPK
jgi:hypothetical protein